MVSPSRQTRARALLKPFRRLLREEPSHVPPQGKLGYPLWCFVQRTSCVAPKGGRRGIPWTRNEYWNTHIQYEIQPETTVLPSTLQAMLLVEIVGPLIQTLMEDPDHELWARCGEDFFPRA